MDIQSSVLELVGSNVSTNYITLGPLIVVMFPPRVDVFRPICPFLISSIHPLTISLVGPALCPADPQKTLGIKLPFLVMIIKNVRPPPSLTSSAYANRMRSLFDLQHSRSDVATITVLLGQSSSSVACRSLDRNV